MKPKAGGWGVLCSRGVLLQAKGERAGSVAQGWAIRGRVGVWSLVRFGHGVSESCWCVV